MRNYLVSNLFRCLYYGYIWNEQNHLDLYHFLFAGTSAQKYNNFLIGKSCFLLKYEYICNENE